MSSIRIFSLILSLSLNSANHKLSLLIMKANLNLSRKFSDSSVHRLKSSPIFYIVATELIICYHESSTVIGILPCDPSRGAAETAPAGTEQLENRVGAAATVVQVVSGSHSFVTTSDVCVHVLSYFASVI